MSTRRDTYKYHFKVGSKIVHRGITSDLARREREHRQSFRYGHIRQIGRRTSREGALRWEKEGGPAW